ncbi:MAG TPA: porin family protein [Anaerolineales bacterium]
MKTIRLSSPRPWVCGGLLVAWSVSVSGLLATTAQAEWYLGGYGGVSVPGGLSNTTVSDATLGGGVTNARIQDLELKSGLLGGVKGGYFFESRPWLGLETELYTLKPDVKQQTILGGTTSGSVFAANIPSTSLRVSVWAVNLVIRSPSMSEVFQPYGGVGYGLFFATGSQRGQSNTQINPGFQFIAGARYVLTQEWALFGEFKYNNTTIRFSGIKGNYDSQSFVAGLMWHFGR